MLDEIMPGSPHFRAKRLAECRSKIIYLVRIE